MRFESRTWFLLSLLLFAAAIYFWKRGNEYQSRKSKPPVPARQDPTNNQPAALHRAGSAPFQLLTRLDPDQLAPGTHAAPMASPAPRQAAVTPRRTDTNFPYRLSNTARPLRELTRAESAVLMRNAFIDTRERAALPIPPHLRAEGDPGHYIAQSRGPIRASFRERLHAAGATIVAYIPNNAYLVQLSAAGAQALAGAPDIQAVLPYEPYYKLDSKLLPLAVEKETLAPGQWLRVTAFPGQRDALVSGLARLSGEVLAEERTPFGPQLLVKPSPDSLPGIARLAAVQTVELFHRRELLTDQTRVVIGLAANGTTSSNYLNLTGTNVMINLNDSGVDSDHPDLKGRVFGDTSEVLSDPFAHGTHIAGIMVGSGAQSASVSGTPPGSDTNANFRGIAPRAQLFVQPFPSFPEVNRFLDDTYLQETAAQTNAAMSRRRSGPMVSNNSWGYVGVNEYDSSSARFDAAVRDAWPEGGGSQPMIFVFAAGNSGEGTDQGNLGDANSIPAPANGKNVITVGAVESLRGITNGILSTNTDGSITTNSLFLGMTDSTDQVAAFSSRGNVGIGTEGEFGRFKPDVVAPGSFLISTRAESYQLENQVDTNSSQFEILRDLNEPLAPLYRYESGTSQSAPVVAGMLALMQEFFEQRLAPNLRRTNSPALMKALLINGARSLGPLYDFQVQTLINYQGWGLVNISNTLPARLLTPPENGWPVRMFDQVPTNALATGQSKSWRINLSTNAQDFPLRITLVWTDPPGNPNAAIKLVNDLDLVVSNEVTSEVFYGNNIEAGSDFTRGSFPDEPVVSDVVNNVENVFIRTPATTNLVVSVVARRVNVAAQPNYNQATGRILDVVQDYALVISTGEPGITNAFTVTSIASVPAPQVTVTPMTNGVPLLNQRAGANAPLNSFRHGITNQWNFYVFTNVFITNDISTLTNGTNVAFVTFLPPNVGRPRNLSSDIDLYVSMDARLVDLHPDAVEAAWKSTTRGGTESIVFTNALIGDVFYVGVKAEDQQGGEYGLIVLSTDQPFEEEVDGAKILNGMPVPQTIPDGSANSPGQATVIAVGISPIVVQRVVVTNVLTHQDVGDLTVILDHEQSSVVLHNHTLNNGFFNVTNAFFVYDDSGFGAGLGNRRSDGPGSLNEFAGSQGNGVWMVNFVDNAPAHTGRVELVSIRLDPFNTEDLGAAGSAGISGTVGPNDAECFYVDVPPQATNLIIALSQLTGPLDVFVSRGQLPTTNVFERSAQISPPGGTLIMGANDEPIPLGVGRYFICLQNSGSTAVNFHIVTEFQFGVGLDFRRTLLSTNAVPLLDDGVIVSSVNVPVDKQVASVQVAVRILHPRSSDLVLHLVSPQGTRLLLAENRGGIDSTGYGAGSGTNMTFTIFTENTNQFPDLEFIKFSLPPWNDLNTSTNPPLYFDSFESAVPGTYLTNQTFGNWSVVQGEVEVHTVGNPLNVTAHTGTNFVELDTTRSPASILTSIDTVPGKEYALRLYYHRNPGAPLAVAHALQLYYGPPLDFRPPTKFIEVPDFGWQSSNIIFTATTPVTQLEVGSLTGSGPLVDTISLSDVVVATNVYVLPEEPLSLLNGERALGDWTLEVWDTRRGPAGGRGSLLAWELQVEYGNPPGRATFLTNGVTFSGTLTGNETNYFVVEVCETSDVAFTTLTGPQNSLNLLIDREGFPTTNTETDDFVPLVNDLMFDEEAGLGSATFLLTSDPHQPAPLMPGKRLFFAVHNLNPGETNTFDFRVSLDNDTCTKERPVIVLENDVPYTNIVAPSGILFDYYVFTVSPTAVEAEFEVTPRNGDVGLVLRQGLPLPDLNLHDYRSDLPGITNELIVLTNASTPVALLPGDWYLGVYNNATNAVVYDVRASEVLDTNLNVVFLTNAVPLEFTLQEGAGLTNYFQFKVLDSYPGVKFELFDLNGNADLLISFNDLPTPTNHFLSNSASPTQPVSVEILTNAQLPEVRGNWLLSVINKDPTNLTFTLLATIIETNALPPPATTNRIFDPDITVSQTNICFSWTATVGLQYRLEGKRSLGEADWTTLFALTATNTFVSYCMDLPSEFSFFRVVEIGTGPTEPPVQNIINPTLSFRTNELCLSWSSTVGLTYEVQGKQTVTDASWADLSGTLTATSTVSSYCIPLPTPYQFFQVIENAGATNPPPSGPVIVALENNVSYRTNIVAPSGTGYDYYVFNVSPAATGAEFEVIPQNGNVGLVLSYGLPLPALSRFDYRSDETGPSPELIVLTNASSPVPLLPGDWYIGVYNNTSSPVTYDVRAREVLDPSANLIPLENGVPLDFTLPQGAGLTNYFVLRVTERAPRVAFELSNLNADADLYIGFNVLPNPNAYLISSPASPTEPVFLEVDTNAALPEVRGTWALAVVPLVPTNLSFTIRGSYRQTTTNPPPVTSTNRYFDPAIAVTATNLCLSWPTTNGFRYQLEGKQTLSEIDWTVLFGPVAGEGSALTFCTNLPTDFVFFRVNERGTSAPPPPPSQVISNPTLVLSSNEICLSWDSAAGTTYIVQGKQSIAGGSWTNLSQAISGTGATASHCIPLPTPYRFFQVVTGSGGVPGGVGSTNGVALLTPAVLATGALQLAWVSEPGVVYEVQVATNLAPAPRWTTLTNIAGTGGQVTITDSTRVAEMVMRFYRVLQR